MQTWKNHDIPERWQSSPQAFREFMPSWEYHLMTDADNREFVATYFPEYLAMYDGFIYPIQRADCIRYMWLYIHGGIYMDLDVVIRRSLDDLFAEPSCLETDSGMRTVYLVPSGNISSYYTNAIMASQPRAPFWLEVLEEVRASTKNPSPLWVGRHFYVMNTTGPMMLTRVVGQTKEEITTLPGELLVPCSVCDLPCQPKEEAYAYAIPGSSWVTWDTLIYNFLLCHWWKIAIVIGVFLLIIVIAWLCL